MGKAKFVQKFEKFLLEEKGFSPESLLSDAPYTVSRGVKYRPGLLAVDLHIGEYLFLVEFSPLRNPDINHARRLRIKTYLSSVKASTIPVYLVFPSVEKGFQILELSKAGGLHRVENVEFPSYSLFSESARVAERKNQKELDEKEITEPNTISKESLERKEGRIVGNDDGNEQRTAEQIQTKSNIKNKTWYFLADVKSNELLSGLIARRNKKRNLYVNIFLGIATSSSIGGWALWENTSPYLWGTIIGLSQLITILRPNFAFSKYVSVFSEKEKLWRKLSIEVEELWHHISIDNIGPKDAIKQFFSLRNIGSDIDELPDELIFNDHKKLCKLAENQCNIYLKKV